MGTGWQLELLLFEVGSVKSGMTYQPKSLNIEALEERPILKDISIVIPTLGRPILEESLYWILNGSAWPGGLIVVDQGGNPTIGEWLGAICELGIEAVYVPSKQRGRSAGINRGIERAKTRFITVTDDDCFVEENWLEKLTNLLRENPGAIVTGRIEAGTEDVVLVVTSQETSIQKRPSFSFDHMSGGNMGTSQAVFERVGLFDEHQSIRTAEDAEFAYRSLRAGIPIIYTPDAGVHHFGWRDEGQRTSQYESYARSHGGFYGKYLRKGDWFIVVRTILHYLRASRRWLRGTLSRDEEMAAVGRAYVTNLFPGIVAGLKRSHYVE
jgi:cellulose synthase/poly-beta-1,6-N-acetylglucosamine synthase-like glycosyltransferase